MCHFSLDSYKIVAGDSEREFHNLLNAAIDLPSEQRWAFLESAASRPELAIEVETLLREEDGEEDFLTSPLEGLVSWTATIAAPTLSGERSPMV